MPLYEHVFLARQDVSAQQVEELTAQLTGVIEQLGGKVTKLEQWGVKSLSYRVRKNRKAHFTFMNVDAPSAALSEIERQERLNEDVLRYLTIRVDEHEEGPSAMMRKSDRDRDRDDRGGGFRDRDRGDRGDRGGGFRDRDRGDRGPRDRAPRDEPVAGARTHAPPCRLQTAPGFRALRKKARIGRGSGSIPGNTGRRGGRGPGSSKHNRYKHNGWRNNDVSVSACDGRRVRHDGSHRHGAGAAAADRHDQGRGHG